MKYTAFLLLLGLTLTGNNSYAQPAATGAWYNYFGANPLGRNWTVHNEIQYRNYNMGGDLDQLLLRAGIGYNLSPNNNNLLVGYGYIYNNPYIGRTDARTTFTEHRIFQQFITRQRFGRFYLQHRYRLEERFIDKAPCTLRFRYFLALNIPINKKEMGRNALYLSGYNEVFLGKQSPYFDRNRLYGALGYSITKDLRVEAGYMYQSLQNSSRGQFQLCVFNSIPFRSQD